MLTEAALLPYATAWSSGVDTDVSADRSSRAAHNLPIEYWTAGRVTRAVRRALNGLG